MVEEPAPGLIRIPLLEGFVAAYLMADEGELTLVDTGPPGSLAAIKDAARSAGVDLGTLTRIVVTHAHADHSGSAVAVRERTGAPILMSGSRRAPDRLRPGFARPAGACRGMRRRCRCRPG